LSIKNIEKILHHQDFLLIQGKSFQVIWDLANATNRQVENKKTKNKNTLKWDFPWIIKAQLALKSHTDA
jgi:hypothetical protein